MFVNVLDPDLASLAANAAVELDLLINDEPAGLDAVRQLGSTTRRLRRAGFRPTRQGTSRQHGNRNGSRPGLPGELRMPIPQRFSVS